MQFGVCSNPENHQICREAGFAFLEPAACNILAPALSDAEWAPRRDTLLAVSLPIPVCNLFFPGETHLVGPERNLDQLAAYAERLFARLQIIGAGIQVLGSGKARTAPPDYPRERATAELLEAVRMMAPLAARHGVTIAMEHLRPAESGLLTTAAETLEFVRQADHPAVGFLADTYHLGQVGESIEIMRAAADQLVHVHIADPVGRFDPATAQSDLRPVLRLLKEIGYDRRVSLECRWTDFAAQAAVACRYIMAQWEEA